MTSGHPHTATGSFIHTFTHRRRCQPRKATASPSGAVRVRRLAQGHLDTRLGEEPGIEPATLRLPADPLYLLSCCLPVVRMCRPGGTDTGSSAARAASRRVTPVRSGRTETSRRTTRERERVSVFDSLRFLTSVRNEEQSDSRETRTPDSVCVCVVSETGQCVCYVCV